VRLLVVDDDTVFREELSTLLSDWGHQVESVNSAAKALEALEIAEFDVVLSDVRMPRMNGIELLRAVRERWPRVYVVMITGYATVETAVEAMKLGAFDYLRKPFRSENVQAVIGMIEEQRRFSLGGAAERDPVRLAEKWAKQKREVLLLGVTPKRPTPGITVADLPLTDSAVGLQELILRFVESHPHPAVVIGGIERLFTVHRAEEVAHLLGEVLERVEGKAPVAVGFDPLTLSDQSVLQIRAAVSAARVHGTLSALANPLRRHILRRLDEGATSFTEVMRAAGIDDSPKLSFHLRTLQEDGLIAHAGDSYQLSANGKEAVRVLKEVDQMGSKEEDRMVLFPTSVPGETTPTSKGRSRH
jgi:CheY-like chemotaxis protein/DNA-binding HxlR family transcriptional regulator